MTLFSPVQLSEIGIRLKHFLFEPLLEIQMNQDQTTPFMGLSIATFLQAQLSKSLHHTEFLTTSVISTTGARHSRDV